MGDYIDVEFIVQRLKEMYSASETTDANNLPASDVEDAELKHWGISKTNDRYSIAGGGKYENFADAIAYMQNTLDKFLNNTPKSKLRDILSAHGFSIRETSRDYYLIIGDDRLSTNLYVDEIPEFMKQKFSPKEILQFARSATSSGAKTHSGLYAKTNRGKFKPFVAFNTHLLYKAPVIT